MISNHGNSNIKNAEYLGNGGSPPQVAGCSGGGVAVRGQAGIGPGLATGPLANWRIWAGVGQPAGGVGVRVFHSGSGRWYCVAGDVWPGVIRTGKTTGALRASVSGLRLKVMVSVHSSIDRVAARMFGNQARSAAPSSLMKIIVALSYSLKSPSVR